MNSQHTEEMECEDCGGNMEPVDDIFKARWRCPDCGHVQEEDLGPMEGAMNVRKTIKEEVQPALLELRAKVEDLKEKIKGNSS